MKKILEQVPFAPVLARSTEGLSAALDGLIRQLTGHFPDVGFRLNRVLPKDGSERMTHPLPLAAFTAAALPAAADWPGCVIYVPDGSPGQKFRGSDGSSWVNLG
jgi:hypothetical protein